MTTSLPVTLPAMHKDAVASVSALEQASLKLPQVNVPTYHHFHAGMYARTIMIPANTVLTGALIKLATLLIVNGDVIAYTGGGTVHLIGYHVIPAEAGRKQAFTAVADTILTMIFPTSAKSVEEAEEEFTDEAALLFSRKEGAINVVFGLEG